MDGSHADILTPKQWFGGRGGASRRLQNIEVADLVCPPSQMWGLSRRRLRCSRLSIAQQGRALHTGAVQSDTQHMQPARQGGHKGTQCHRKVLSHLSQVRKVPKVKPRSQESKGTIYLQGSPARKEKAWHCLAGTSGQQNERAANSCICKHLRATWNHHAEMPLPTPKGRTPYESYQMAGLRGIGT